MNAATTIELQGTHTAQRGGLLYADHGRLTWIILTSACAVARRRLRTRGPEGIVEPRAGRFFLTLKTGPGGNLSDLEWQLLQYTNTRTLGVHNSALRHSCVSRIPTPSHNRRRERLTATRLRRLRIAYGEKTGNEYQPSTSAAG